MAAAGRASEAVEAVTTWFEEDRCPLAREVIETRRAVVVPDLLAHPATRRLVERESRWRGSAAVLPLVWEGEVVGIYAIHADHADAFGEDSLRLLQSIAVDVVFARSLYAGAAHASGPLSGEILGILGGQSPADVREGLAACVRCLEHDACFYTANADGSLAIFPHVVHAIGSYLARESGLEVGAPLAYLIAPPLEAWVGVDAALKAADVRLVKNFAPPTETNFAGAYLTGSLEQCEAAAVAFAEAIVAVGHQPRVL